MNSTRKNQNVKLISIIGGGPAGLSCAIQLAKHGWEVTLFERKTYPHNKVCGEFLSPEAWNLLKHLDILDEIRSSNPSCINELLVSDQNGNCITSKLRTLSNSGLSGIGLSRDILDTLLYEKAKSLGVHIHTNSSVQDFQTEPDRIILNVLDNSTLKTTEHIASLAIFATGRYIADKQIRKSKKSLFGIKAHYQNVSEVHNRVELHSFQYGYLGLANINDNLTNLCFVVQQELLNKKSGNIENIIDSMMEHSPLVKQRLHHSSRVSQWYSTGPLSSGLKRFYNERCFYVGDACGAIEPLSGDGITMALTGGVILSSLLSQNLTLEDIALEYSTQLTNLFHSPIRLSRVLGYLAKHPTVSSQFIRLLHFTPGIIDTLVTRTRVPLYKSPLFQPEI